MFLLILELISQSLAGSQIYVVGFVPPGEYPLLIDYIIDGGEAQPRSIIASRANKTLGNQVLFESAVLPTQNHTFSISVKGARGGRNYTLDYFQVVGSDKPVQQKTSNWHNLGLILGVAWGISILLIFSLGAFGLYWRRRRRKTREILTGHVGEHGSPSKALDYLKEECEGAIGESRFRIYSRSPFFHLTSQRRSLCISWLACA